MGNIYLNRVAPCDVGEAHLGNMDAGKSLP